METFEQKYNAALTWMRDIYPSLTGANKEDAEHYFPELKESEDERIRKWLIEMVEELRKANPANAEHNGNCSEALAYLEKQKDYELTEEDRKIIPEALVMLCNDIINHRVHTPINTDEEGARKIKAFLKTFNRRPHKTREEWEGQKPIPANPVGTKEQKPAEWSEEDEFVFESACNALEIHGHHKLSNMLKSLRPQPHWKPSEEQMETLEYYMHALVCNEHKEILFKLYKQLKSL